MGADIDQIVALAHDFLVMLNDDQSVPQIAHLFQCGKKPVIVTGVQADRGFVQNIEHARELRTDLRSQADALILAPGQGGAGSAQSEVFQTHVRKKVQALLDLF